MQQWLSRAPASPALFLLVLSGLAAPRPAQQPAYSVELLPLPAGRKSFAAMNDSGVVGLSIDLPTGTAAFRYANGLAEQLPDPPGYIGSGRARIVQDVDEAGNLIGRFAAALGDRAVRWTDFGMELLPVPNDGAVALVAVAPGGTVAIAGWPFGYFDPAWENEYGWGVSTRAEPDFLPFRDPMQVFLWDEGSLEPVQAALDAGALSEGLRIDGINDAGQMALTQDVDLAPRAFWFDPENGLHALPTLGGTVSSSYAINALGEIAGVVRSRGDRTRPVVWRNGRGHELPLVPGYTEAYAIDLNESGQVAGTAYASVDHSTAVVWINGQATDLSRFLPAGSGWQLRRTFAINTQGQILVQGQIGGLEELFLLTPIAPLTSGGHAR